MYKYKIACINLFIDYAVKFYSNPKFRVSKEYERNFELAINTDSCFLDQFISTRIIKTKNTSDTTYKYDFLHAYYRFIKEPIEFVDDIEKDKHWQILLKKCNTSQLL